MNLRSESAAIKSGTAFSQNGCCGKKIQRILQQGGVHHLTIPNAEPEWSRTPRTEDMGGKDQEGEAKEGGEPTRPTPRADKKNVPKVPNEPCLPPCRGGGGAASYLITADSGTKDAVQKHPAENITINGRQKKQDIAICLRFAPLVPSSHVLCRGSLTRTWSSDLCAA